MKIEKKQIDIAYKKVIKNAYVTTVPTGDSKEQTIIKQDGSTVVEQVPITTRVSHAPVFEDAIEKRNVFVVKTKSLKPTSKGFIETEENHEFANEKDAKNFILDTSKRLNK